MGKQLVLILGGARSGKSSFAEKYAHKRGGADVLFVATAQAGDEEMSTRIALHRASRPNEWKTLETPHEIGRALQTAPRTRVVLIDCATLWVSNVLLANELAASETMTRQVDELLGWYRSAECDLIIVSNEVGMGLVPENALGRAYRDLLGLMNRKLAEQADLVLLLVAGMPIDIKSHAIRLEDL
jgi:adenosylcobinamide kinase / adenosylcobinamide-phosphate guanylyltransferase